MTMFPTNQYAKGFLSPNSAKPIVGVVSSTAYNRTLSQAKIKTNGITQGQPVLVKNLDMFGHTTKNAGQGLAPLVLMAEKATTAVSGFIVESPNMVYIDGQEGPQYLANQIAYVALLGSGTELYLPIQDEVNDFDVVNEKLCWHLANRCIQKGEGDASTMLALPNITILSMAVSGLQFYYDDGSNSVKAKDVNVVKVRL